MNEFFADTIELWSFNLLKTKFHLIINNSQNQFWREFFADLESGKDIKVCRHILLSKIVKAKYSDFDESKIETMWEKFPNYFDGNIKSNFEKLENDSDFQSILREIKISRIIS